ncbi:MAG: septum formation initiator family protein [Bacteroidetes bacterium]|jgi:cell division protein FtsB|nr:septum formation initiator family protein [Bacteroidota bacterium]
MNRANIVQFLKNKYFLVAVFFLVWMGFFDQNDWMNRKKVDQDLQALTRDKEFFITEVEKLKEVEKGLLYNEAELERYAREKYFMKKADEDLYVIVD